MACGRAAPHARGRSLRLEPALHAGGGNRPGGAVQIEFGPLGFAQFTRPQEEQWGQRKRCAHNRRALIGIDRTQQLTQLRRVGDGGPVLATDSTIAPFRSRVGSLSQ